MPIQKGSSSIISIVSLIVILGLAGTFFLFQEQKGKLNVTSDQIVMPTVSQTSSPKVESSTTFQSILVNNCLNEASDKSLSGEIDLDELPITIKLNDLKSKKGSCDSDFAKYVNVSLGEEYSFMTISDKNSNHCCHGPSTLEPTGKHIKTIGDINIYLHTGTWIAGPNSGYKPIVARGVKNFKLNNGEEIRVVLDRTALNKTDTSLQQIEDKYQIIDPDFDSGVKVLTPEVVEKMFMDDFFSNFGENSVIKMIEANLQNITLKK